MIEFPRAAWPFQPGCTYFGEVSRIVVARLPALGPGALSCAVKIAVRGKVTGGGCSPEVAEGPEVVDNIHFDGAFQPLNALAQQMVAALPEGVAHGKDLAGLEGRMGRFRLGKPDRHTGYNPVTDWQPVERTQLVPGGLPTSSPYEFRQDGRQFRVRFTHGGGVEEGCVAANGGTRKIHAILRAAPDSIGYEELDSDTRPAVVSRSTRRLEDETGLARAGGANDFVFDNDALAGYLAEIRRIGVEVQEALSVPSEYMAQEAEGRRLAVLRHIASGVGRNFAGEIKKLERACRERDQAEEDAILRRLARKIVKGRTVRSDADRLRDRVRDSVAYGLKLLADAKLGRLSAYIERHLEILNGSYRYTDASLARAWWL